jgi:hypothetical protein
MRKELGERSREKGVRRKELGDVVRVMEYVRL